MSREIRAVQYLYFEAIKVQDYETASKLHFEILPRMHENAVGAKRDAFNEKAKPLI